MNFKVETLQITEEAIECWISSNDHEKIK